MQRVDVEEKRREEKRRLNETYVRWSESDNDESSPTLWPNAVGIGRGELPAIYWEIR